MVMQTQKKVHRVYISIPGLVLICRCKKAHRSGDDQNKGSGLRLDRTALTKGTQTIGVAATDDL